MRRLAVTVALVASLLAFSSLPAGAEERNAQQWLAQMTETLKTLNYRGTFVYLHDGQVETLELAHGYTPDVGERERLWSLDGRAREVLRTGQQVTCIWPSRETVWVDVLKGGGPTSGLPSSFRIEIEQLQDHYTFDLGRTDRVAGFPARVVRVRPKDRLRYGYTLWLEQDSAMLLRSDLVDNRGELIEQLVFTDLRLLDRPPEGALALSTELDDFEWHYEKNGHSPSLSRDELAWQFDDLPPGFHLKRADHRRFSHSEHDVLHLLFSDGLVNVSVFIEQRDPSDEPVHGPTTMGATRGFGRIVDAHQLIAMGEAPETTVEWIAKSLVLRDD